MSQYPNPQFQPGSFQPVPPPRTSGAAIASLILGILGCVPLLTGIFAVILGIVGLNATKKPNVGGKGLAIAGLILGLLSIVGWTSIGGLMGYGWMATAPNRAAAKTFITDLSNGDVTSASAMCVPGTTTESLQKTCDQIKSLGALSSVHFFSFHVNSTNGNSSSVVAGNAIFGTSPLTVRVTFVSQPDGSEKIKSWEIH